MKKVIIFILVCIVIVIAFIFYNYMQFKEYTISINTFNKGYLEYDRKSLYGTDITTVINKAMNNNEICKIPKDENGIYIPDNNYSIKIYLNLYNSSSMYTMEQLYDVGISDFTKYFGELKFECTQINYHENGRISEMYFQNTSY